MRKYAPLLALFLVLALFAGCAAAPAPSSTPEPTAAPTAEPTTAPTAQPTAEPTAAPTPVPSGKIEADADAAAYFGGDVEQVIETLGPVLKSVALTNYAYPDGFTANPDSNFTWGVLYQLLVSFDQLPELSDTLEGGVISVHQTGILEMLKNTFTEPMEIEPFIGDDFETSIAYTAGQMTYQFQPASGEGVYAEPTKVRVQGESGDAVVTVEIRDESDAVVATAEVVVTANPASASGYTASASSLLR